MIRPRPHQKQLLEYIANNTLSRIFLYHSLGSGKTITSLMICMYYKYISNSSSKIVISAPVSILANFTKEIKFLGYDPEYFEVISHNRLIRNLNADLLYLKDKIVIIDEVHHFRNYTKTTASLVKGINKASYVVLLSATPLVNNIMDFTVILAILSKTSMTTASEMLYDKDIINKMVSCYKISNTDLIHYPKTTYTDIKLYMTPDYYKSYMAVEDNEIDKLPAKFKQKDFTVFLTGLRKASNKIHIISPKFNWIIEHYKKSPKKTLIYSNWKDSGLYILKDLLAKDNIRCEIIDGSVNVKDRNFIVEQYNQNKFNILLISSAGAEGLDLKQTRQVIILEPHWNNEKINQVIGRAVRYKSHLGLSESKHNVNIYRLFLLKPKANYLLNPLRFFEKPSIDIYMQELSDNKSDIISTYSGFIKSNCIEALQQ